MAEPSIVQVAGRTAFQLDNGQLLRRLNRSILPEPIPTTATDMRRMAEVITSIRFSFTDLGAAPSNLGELYVGWNFDPDGNNAPLDNTTTYFIGLYKASSGWGYDAATKCYTVAASGFRAISRTGTTNTDRGSLNASTIYLPTLSSSVPWGFMIVYAYYQGNNHNVSLSGITNYTNYANNYPLFAEWGRYHTFSISTTLPGFGWTAGSAVSFTAYETATLTRRHFYIGWKPASGVDCKLYISGVSQVIIRLM